MIRAAALLSVLAVPVALDTGPAQAQQNNCAARSTIVTKPMDDYGEVPVGIGLAANNAVMEVFASSETGTWTITVTFASGLMCLVASGQNYESLDGAVRPNL